MSRERSSPEAAARRFFLRDDNRFGCAESALLTLQEAYGLPDAGDSSAAMALNGGVAYSGGICGAISGAAMAVGRLSDRRIEDHTEAKRVARRLTRWLMARFDGEFGSHDCRTLLGMDISDREQHDAFIASGIWRTRCMRQIELSVGLLAELVDEDVWERRLRELGSGDDTAI